MGKIKPPLLYVLTGKDLNTMGEAMLSLKIRHRFPSSSVPTTMLSTTALTTGVLQATNRPRAVDYFFWILPIANLDTSGNS